MLQLIYEGLLNRHTEGHSPGILGRAASKIFRRVMRGVGPVVAYSVDGVQIKVPPSHETPFLWRLNNDYSKSLGRMALACAQKYPNGLIIDIGANIGDSAAIIRSQGVKNTIVSVEGVQRFYDVLLLNIPNLGDTIPVKAIIGTSHGGVELQARITEGGNAHIYQSDEQYGSETKTAVPLPDIDVMTIAQLAASVASERIAKFVKTDIECYDIPVLNGSLDLIAKSHPLIFMELHIRDIDERVKGVTWRELWGNLKDIGYSKSLYWYNSGDFLCMLDLNLDESIIDDIHGYLRNRGGTLYVDVCLFHADDADIAKACHIAEKHHAIAMRAKFGDV